MQQETVLANDQPPRAGRRDRVLKVIPALLLVSIALVQLYRAHAQDLTAWKGGGFGMFATVDRLNHRMVFAYLLTDQGEVPLPAREFSSNPYHTYWRTRALPHSRHAQQLARILAERTWYPSHETQADGASMLVARQSAAEQVEPIDFSALRLEVWRLEFDSADARLGRRQLASHQVERPR